MTITENTAAATLVISVGVSLVFSVVTVFLLVLRVRTESRASMQERWNLYAFLQGSAEIFDEYYRRRSRREHPESDGASSRLASET